MEQPSALFCFNQRKRRTKKTRMSHHPNKAVSTYRIHLAGIGLSAVHRHEEAFRSRLMSALLWHPFQVFQSPFSWAWPSATLQDWQRRPSSKRYYVLGKTIQTGIVSRQTQFPGTPRRARQEFPVDGLDRCGHAIRYRCRKRWTAQMTAANSGARPLRRHGHYRTRTSR
jgi:hypothetical protein